MIKQKASESTPWWAPRTVPPKGAPNVLLIMTDDAGFAAPSTFGGVIPTPALDKLAAGGPALHQLPLHLALLADPGGADHRPQPPRRRLRRRRRDRDRLPRLQLGHPQGKRHHRPILRDNGYATSWFGKNHNTPFYQASQAGPFDQWPTGMGFEYFYGFIGGDASQWQPNLFRNTTAIYPFEGNPGWNLTTAMADEAIDHMQRLKEVAPDKPFFVYYVPGGTHAPHHPTPEWVKKISDMHLFDDGWNKLRDTMFANQKRLGIMPETAQLTAWPKGLPEWDTLSEDEKVLFRRQADVYGAYLAYTDHEIGRVVQAVEDMGERDNTLIIYIAGDNGASAGGHAQRHAERVHHLQRRLGAGEGPDALVSVLGLGAHLPALRRRLGLGDGHAVPVGEAGRLALRRHRAGPRHVLARPHQRHRAASAGSSTT